MSTVRSIHHISRRIYFVPFDLYHNSHPVRHCRHYLESAFISRKPSYPIRQSSNHTTMSASQVKLSLEDCGVFHLPSVSSEAAARASTVLQENHDNHHIFFSQSGFHNHIAHHILTLYALGSSPGDIQRQYDHNKSRQRPQQPVDDSVIVDLHDYKKFHKYLGNERYYHDFLLFFQQEMEKKGYEEVINQYCLKGDERAGDMLIRLHAGKCLHST